MPGRTPAEAFEDFITPLKSAASCLGQVKLLASPGGRTNPDAIHAWSLNGATGQSFRGGWRLEAGMHYSFQYQKFAGEWRVRTHGYRYQLALQGTHLWRIHWHPTTNSGYDFPHYHLNFGNPGELPEPSLDKHYPCGRMTFEDAIEWVFNSPIEPARDDWRDVIRASREVHMRHRSWSSTPPLI